MLDASMVARLSPEQECRVWDAAACYEVFHGHGGRPEGDGQLVGALEADAIPYAIVGAMALNELGYERVTTDVDVLLTRDGLAKFKANHLGRGYAEKFAGSKGTRDVEHNVNVDVRIAGESKPIAFPDPATAIRGTRLALLPAERLIELKLASGMTAPHRIKDLADIVGLIRHAKLRRSPSSRVDAFVRAKYFELWESAQVVDDE